MNEMFESMMRVVRAECGTSKLYAEMMLSLTGSQQVNLNEMIKRIDTPNFKAFLQILEWARSADDRYFAFEHLVFVHKKELLEALQKND